MKAFTTKIKQRYVKQTQLETDLKSVSELVEKDYVSKKSFKKTIKLTESKIEELDIVSRKSVKTVKAMDSKVIEVNAKMEAKAESHVVESIQKELLTYASYKDLKALYNKVVP